MLPTLPANSVHCVVTSPPYYGLRDYGVAGQLGLEATPDKYIQTMVAVFREVRRVLRDDGTCWVNMGDSYAGGAGGRSDRADKAGAPGTPETFGRLNSKYDGTRLLRDGGNAKPKDLLMMPARLALALQADGWWIRSDIIWSKPNPMPESVVDRPTSAHEHIFLLTKAPRYYYDADAVREDAEYGRSPCTASWHQKADAASQGLRISDTTTPGNGGTRNLRNVWTIATHAYPEAHFATFPPDLAERCIKAGCPRDGTVLDPFAGAGTTCLVADRLQRDAIGIELNESYAIMARNRIVADAPLFAEVAD